MEKVFRLINSNEQKLTDTDYSVMNTNIRDGSLPSSELASFSLALNLTLAILSFYFHFLIKRMASRENNKVGETLHGRALTIYAHYMPFAHLWTIINAFGIMSYIFPAAKILGPWYCYMIEIEMNHITAYVGSFSLLIATMKYWFIVHTENCLLYTSPSPRDS